ncbi:MAG: hypothetical protein V3V08_17880 [Nannocystaceae bacterium]
MYPARVALLAVMVCVDCMWLDEARPGESEASEEEEGDDDEDEDDDENDDEDEDEDDDEDDDDEDEEEDEEEEEEDEDDDEDEEEDDDDDEDEDEDDDEEAEDDNEDNGAIVSHAAHLQPIWNARCVSGCHEPGGTWSFSPLTPEEAYATLVLAFPLQLPTQRFVVSGEPENSYLWRKVNGTHLDFGGGGARMPPGGTSLDAAQLNLIVNWILDGAPE